LGKDIFKLNGINEKILINSIYEIENTYRPLYFRILEYIYLTICVLISKFTVIRIPNLTVGKYQVGILNYLKYLGNNVENTHLSYVEKLSIVDLVTIFKICISESNDNVTSFVLRGLIHGKQFSSVNGAIKFIGLGYNGSYDYSMKLNAIYQQKLKTAPNTMISDMPFLE